MRLDVWLTLHRISKKDFASSLGIHRGALHHILSGNRLASIKLAKKIYRATGGKVKVKTLKQISHWDKA